MRIQLQPYPWCHPVPPLQVERASNYARVMREQMMLGSLIRLADYMFVEGENTVDGDHVTRLNPTSLLPRQASSPQPSPIAPAAPVLLVRHWKHRILFPPPPSHSVTPPPPRICTAAIIDRAVTSAEELLALLTSAKQQQQQQLQQQQSMGAEQAQQQGGGGGKQIKGIFLTTISFLPKVRDADRRTNVSGLGSFL